MAAEGEKKFVSRDRRDRLLAMEAKARSWWEEEEVFKAEACEEFPKPGEKLIFWQLPLPLHEWFSASWPCVFALQAGVCGGLS